MSKVALPSWDASNHPARLWSKLPDGRIQCHLSPRNCIMREGQAGFCRVRQNVGGELVTLNYGRATQLTQESIETEAVFHFAPGARILSLGNIGCMMACDYCHNWKTSQAKFVDNKDVKHYTPEQVVDWAEQQGIRILSWTYNDPVVWHEFVLDTAALARKRGMRNLFKSAFFISVAGASELCDVIDIFSISIKSMDPAFYRRLTKGWIEPVLEAAKFVYARGKHVEISNLMVTDANDSEEDSRAVAKWVRSELSERTPLHYVRFHPDYKYTHVGRTPIDRLERARAAAFEEGIKYCYLGNVYGHDAANTRCSSCGNLLVERYGLNTWIRGLDQSGKCAKCGTSADFVALDLSENPLEERREADIAGIELAPGEFIAWANDVNSCHVEVNGNGANEATDVYFLRVAESGEERGPYKRSVSAGGGRFILSRSQPDEAGVRLLQQNGLDLRLYRVFDRAHYPTVDVHADGGTIKSPAPAYTPGQERQRPYRNQAEAR